MPNHLGYSEQQLANMVRNERTALIRERSPLARRLAAIDQRLAELDKADELLEIGFDR